MTILLRVGLKVVISFVLLCAFVLIALFFTFRSAKFKDWLEAELSERSGFHIQIANLAFRLPFHIVAGKVQVSKPGALVLNAARLNITIMPFDALSNTLQKLDVEKPVLQLDLEEMLKSTTKASAGIALRHLNVREGIIVLKKGEATVFELPKINLSADNLNLGRQAGIDLRADLPQLNGELLLHMSGEPRNLEMEIVVRPKHEQSPSVRQNPDGAANEILRVHAALRAPENESAEATIGAKFHELVIGKAQLSGDLASRIAIDRAWTTAAFSGRAVLVDFPKAIYPAVQKLPNGAASADFTGAFAFSSKTLSVKSEITSPLGAAAGEGEIRFEPQARIARAKLIIREIPWDSVKTVFPAPLDRWIYQGRSELDLNVSGVLDALDVEGILRSAALRIRSENMNIGNLAVTAPLRWKNSALRINDAKLSGTQVIYGAKDQWQASAEQLLVSASFEVERDAGFKISGAFTTGGGKFSSPDSAKVGENIKLSGPFEIAWLPGKASIHLNGNWRAEAGEILWGKFFADLKTRAPALEVNTEYLRDNDRLVCHHCKLNLFNIGAIDLIGSLEHLTGAPALRLEAESKNFLPGGFFDFALRESFNRQYPLLDKVSIQGQMTFQLRLAGALDALVAEGDCTLRNGAIRTKDMDWQIGPIALDLPFQVRFPAAQQQPIGNVRRGTLSIEKFSFGTQSFGPVTTAVSLANNALQFYEPLHATVFGGEVEVANLSWPDIISAPQRVSFSGDVKRLQLQQLTEALSWHPFTGTLTGSIPQVQSEENLFRTSGEIQAQVFGGRARIGKLEIENPFSSLPSIKLDASLDGIELEQLSKTFEFGRISGILEGNIHDLAVTDNQPSQFSAEFHSVDRGTEQRISVEALNKITVLSSGENAGLLYGGLAGFFDSFRYSKLGFKADLKNDRLTLRGVETRGDQEFLVVGSFLPPTVNIISHTQVIAFSELLRRLQSIKSDSK